MPDKLKRRTPRPVWTRRSGWGYDNLMFRVLAIPAVLAALAVSSAAQESIDQELEQSSNEHMREELGVNPITTPSIQQILKDLEVFRPVPMALLEKAPLDATFNNRLQTAMHFGSLVADGFLLTVAERPKDVQAVGSALIRQARALGVGERLTKRSKSLLEYSDKGDWLGMRQELVRTQEDVEQSMMELRDEEMAHMISLGGWLRGFQLGATSTVESYSASKAAVLGNQEIVEYFLERLDTLHPRLRKTEVVTTIVDRLRAIRLILVETQGEVPTAEQVAKLRNLADEAEAAALARVDDEGRFLKPQS